jgi:hypothetical protein
VPVFSPGLVVNSIEKKSPQLIFLALRQAAILLVSQAYGF